MKMRFLIVGIATLLFVLAGCTSTPDEMDDMGDMDDMNESTEMMDDGMDESMDESTEMMDDDMSESSMMGAEFTVTIEVLAGSPTPLAPVAWAVHEGGNPFVTGMDRLEGLESLAEDGDPSAVGATLANLANVIHHGVANTPDGAMSPGPATPGHSYSFTVTAESGQRLSFATMFVQSNDLFFSPGSDGLALFDMDMAVDGPVTESVLLYDAGTESNEEPGMGANQAPRQSGPNTGMTENQMVMVVADAMDGYTYPPTSSIIKVTIAPGMGM